MATNQENTGRDLLPIKLIMPKQGAERRVPGDGGPKTPFRTVDAEYRQRLSNQVLAIEAAVLSQLGTAKAAPVRVRVISKATAKSHRPDTLFSEQSCPIIGSGGVGELFIKATARGLSKLKDTINANESEQIIKELSCIESIEAVTPALRRCGQSADDVLRRSPRRGNGFVTRVRLFNLGGDEDQSSLVEDFVNSCNTLGVAINSKGYAKQSWTFAAECRSVAEVEALSKLVSVRSITQMPLIRTVRPNTAKPQALPALPERSVTDTDIPVVVVVDSGVSDRIPAL